MGGGDIFASTVPSFWTALIGFYPLVLLVTGTVWLKSKGICN